MWEASGEGSWSYSGHLEASPDGPAVIEVHLGPAGSAHGRLVTADGSPIADYPFSVGLARWESFGTAGEPWVVTTGEDGTFRVGGIPFGARLTSEEVDFGRHAAIGRGPLDLGDLTLD